MLDAASSNKNNGNTVSVKNNNRYGAERTCNT